MKKGFAGVLAAFAVSALSPVLIPFALDGDGNLNGAGYAAGAMFWLGMIAGIAGYILLYLQYKKKKPSACSRGRKLHFICNLLLSVLNLLSPVE